MCLQPYVCEHWTAVAWVPVIKNVQKSFHLLLFFNERSNLALLGEINVVPTMEDFAPDTNAMSR